jgi:hypothetical protein
MKRTFGLGAVTMISAACAGSSGNTVGEPFDAGGAVFAPPPLPPKDAEPSSDASILLPGPDAAKPDANVDEDLDDAGSCPVDIPLTAADLDKDQGWKPAKAPYAACTSGDLLQLEGNFKNTNIKTYADLGTGLSASCVACVITEDTENNWGPLVTAQGGGTGFVNFGACFGAVESEACGKALQYEQFCYNIACNDCTTTSSERQKCVEKAGSSGMCTSFGSATAKACPNIQTSAKSCNSIIDAAKTLCGPNAGGGDGGDAGQ